jgi:hypothetical protein
MRPTKWLVHDGHVVEIRYERVGRKCEIWLYEDERPLGKYATVSLYEAAASMAYGGDLIAETMENAAKDVESGRLALG